ncbi:MULTISPECIES: diaminopimelate decarboxylase [unclassified Ruminococcus]|uniref:diaminopimelate decarboxylase n=1 Tax=unclassified Ruminococcus TaxID=2608920 RepID=UPI00210D4B54|nr:MULTISPECIES: diaminopimelate decarboxylase [unclassified Ruminococcus]MCQ4023120.1 diaminopimelate decarboxylase [Ruminococcus sp. zg-924]MCQ4115109.1 diaminopimelate decarboxylase [Ruminococcus sp. zg-921]
MFVNDCLNTNEKGHLTIGGCDTVELAKKYGTPLYVLDENVIRNTCKSYVDSFKRHYNGNGLALYASKALSCKALCQIAKEENMGLDVVSGGELYTALKAGFPVENIHFHGNNKTYDELCFAVDSNIGKIVVDNLTELETLDRICAEKGKVQKISMRIKPGVDAHTHNFIRTGQIDSKFGFALETGEAMNAVKEAIELKNVELTELHCHIGSQIFDIDPFVTAAEIMMDFIGAIKNETGHVVTELNLGGGFGIKYTDNDNPTAYDNYMNSVSKAVHSKAEHYGLPVPFVYIEPGRSIVGEAGITLYTVGAVKTIPNVRTYVSIDGGMCDNIRYALYQSEYTVVTANKADKEADTVVTIAGKCCESGDLIQENTKIAKAEPGDTIAVLSTGAYNYSMASNYNRIPKPPIVLVNNGTDKLIVNRESYDDLIKNDLDL